MPNKALGRFDTPDNHDLIVVEKVQRHLSHFPSTDHDLYTHISQSLHLLCVGGEGGGRKGEGGRGIKSGREGGRERERERET